MTYSNYPQYADTLLAPGLVTKSLSTLTLHFPDVFPLPVKLLLCFPHGSRCNLNLFGSRATGSSPIAYILMPCQLLKNWYLQRRTDTWHLGLEVMYCKKGEASYLAFFPQDTCLYHCDLSKPFKWGKFPLLKRQCN